MTCLYHFGSLFSFLIAHIVHPVRTQEGIINMHLRHTPHLFRDGSIAGYIDLAPVAESQYITHAFLDIVMAIVACLDCFDGDVVYVERLMHVVNDGILCPDDMAVRLPVPYFGDSIVVEMFVCDQYEVSFRIGRLRMGLCR